MLKDAEAATFDQPPGLTEAMAGARRVLVARGDWTARTAAEGERLLATQNAQGAAALDLSRIGLLDTYGAWLIERFARRHRSLAVTGMPERYRDLMAEVHQTNTATATAPRHPGGIVEWLAAVGRTMAGVGGDLRDIAAMLGQVMAAAVRVAMRPSTFRFTSVIHHLDRVGFRAVPIVVLITMLIGAILAQQGTFHFRKFGAETFVVDMVGILVLREIGVLLVAIMVAGRSGSAYTAELGSMKMREEMDALRTMGFDPIEVLVLPRIIALVIAVPLLTFIGNIAALFGGGLVSHLYGNLEPTIFLHRLHEAIGLNTFQVGMIKAPVMALVIGIVACTEGLKVKGSAESLGTHTTASVVKAIFLVLVLDGFFAMFFAAIDM
jgi:phospholipid/cholesterol/gamma-HCH transport system permease protein